MQKLRWEADTCAMEWYGESTQDSHRDNATLPVAGEPGSSSQLPISRELLWLPIQAPRGDPTCTEVKDPSVSLQSP